MDSNNGVLDFSELGSGVENTGYPRRTFEPQAVEDNQRNDIDIFLDKEYQNTVFLYRLDNLLELIGIIHRQPTFLTTAVEDSSSMTDRALEFAADCFKFITEGHRSLMIEQWLVMDLDDTGYLSPPDRKKLQYYLRDKENELWGSGEHSAFETLISMWCKQPNGVRDLAYSTKLFASLKT